MKLQKFKERNKNQKYIIIFTIACVLLITGVFLYKTFAIFQANLNEDIINGSIEDPGDIYFAFYYDGSIQKNMPDKSKGYVLDEAKSYCGVTGGNDSNIKVFVTEDNMIHVSGVTTSRTKCNLYFVRGVYILGKGIPIVESGEGLYEVKHDDVTEINEGFKTNEYRYAGKDPNNYIKFNDEDWRIVGLVNVMISETEVEQRVKIIRKDSIGKYSWDLKENNENTNSWNESSLSKLLNEFYYNSQSNITYYNCTSYDFALNKCSQKEVKTIDFSQIGIKENFKNMIEKVYWDISIGSFNTNNFQNLVIEERKGDSFQNNIGMIYPSDYYYTTSVKNSCLLILNWKEQANCYNNAWLTENVEDNSLWTISGYEKDAGVVMRLIHDEKVSGNYHTISYNASTFTNEVKPVLYLKPNVKIINEGDGSEDNPFQLVQILK